MSANIVSNNWESFSKNNACWSLITPKFLQCSQIMPVTAANTVTAVLPRGAKMRFNWLTNWNLTRDYCFQLQNHSEKVLIEPSPLIETALDIHENQHFLSFSTVFILSSPNTILPWQHSVSLGYLRRDSWSGLPYCQIEILTVLKSRCHTIKVSIQHV